MLSRIQIVTNWKQDEKNKLFCKFFFQMMCDKVDIGKNEIKTFLV